MRHPTVSPGKNKAFRDRISPRSNSIARVTVRAAMVPVFFATLFLILVGGSVQNAFSLVTAEDGGSDTGGHIGPSIAYPPTVTNVKFSPGFVGAAPNNVVSVSADVSDPQGVKSVYAFIQGPNGIERAGGSQMFASGITYSTKITLGSESEGNTKVLVNACDNENTCTDPVEYGSFVFDRTAPSAIVKIDDDKAATRSTDVEISLTCNDTGGSGCAKMKISYDGTIDSETEQGITSSMQGSLSAGDGVKTVMVVMVDGSGNVSPVSSDTIILDTKSPTITGKPSRSPDNDDWYNSDLKIAWIADDSGGSGLDEDSCEPINYSGPDSETAKVEATCSDLAGNEATGTYSFKYDETEPLLKVPSSISETTGDRSIRIEFDDKVSATDNLDSSVDISCDPESGSSFSAGETEVTCTATDDAGNEAQEEFEVSVTVEAAELEQEEITTEATNMRPEIAVPSQIVMVEATSQSGAVVEYDDKVSVTDKEDGTLDAECSPSSGSTLPLGVTSVTCTARDSDGQEVDAAFKVSVQDTTPPNIEVSDIQVSGSDQAIPVQFTDKVSVVDLVDGTMEAECSPVSGSIFAIGSSPVSCTVIDQHGNKATASFNVVVAAEGANLPPVMVVPTDSIVVEATGEEGAMVDFADKVSVTDKEDGAMKANCSPASGSVFSTGEVSVTCTATDSAGAKISKTFLVMVKPRQVIASEAPKVAPAEQDSGPQVIPAAVPVVAAVAIGGGVGAIFLKKRLQRKEEPDIP